MARDRHCEKLGDILKRVALRPTSLQRAAARLDQLEKLWKEAAGETVSRHTRLRGERDSCLTVEVDSAPLAQELAGFSGGGILKKINSRREGPPLLRLKFVTGSF